MSDTIRHVTISGRVQGVGYRYFVERAARSRDLEGWVRNRRDGSVEAVFAGSAEAVTAMIAACRRGPASALVEALRDEAASSDMLNLREAGERFSVLPTI
ncbi:acylphosphatase [Bradyrhizobium sp. AUGA SZCCT0283]|uniref:acylphosphatase n=1 Tax=Bradyrhizobium sp. AUGA SZCCT0283 TaxID=2807671 RepID=UPI001BAA39B8|nr:acylphosphatase [Bradyrhizobium sp. AUGA SZCCT0283]MBR1279190.1 acylphosphatase [Bradyrhizobium sp. AUGA SZCCT0283]